MTLGDKMPTCSYLKPSFRVRLFFACVLLTASFSAFGENLRTFTNKEFGFTFQYPNSWMVQPSGTANSRAKVVSPKDSPDAGCAVIVQRYPQLSSLKQVDIDQVFAKRPPPSEIKDGLSQAFSDVAVLAVSVGALHSRPAHLSRVRYSVGAQSSRIFFRVAWYRQRRQG
jgi:hypothetical protein